MIIIPSPNKCQWKGFFLSTCPEMSLQEAVKKSGAIATITVQLQGTQSSYPTASVLETLETD